MECSLCCERFTNRIKCPLLLDCGHSFCKECCIRLQKANKSIICPHCRVATYRQPAQLPKNFAILTLLAPSQNLKCKFHPSYDVKFYCKRDSSFLCEKCVLRHNGHEMSHISSYKQTLSRATGAYESRFKTLKTQFQSMESAVDVLKKSLQEKAEIENNRIDQYFDELIDKINKKRAVLKGELIDYVLREEIKLAETKQEMEKLEPCLAKIRNELHQAKEGSCSSVRRLKKSLSQTLSTLDSTLSAKYNDLIKVKEGVSSIPVVLFSEYPDLDSLYKFLFLTYNSQAPAKPEIAIPEQSTCATTSQPELSLNLPEGPKAVFLGSESRLLVYHLGSNAWSMQTLGEKFEHRNYGACIALDEHELLMVGGGPSNQAFRYNGEKIIQAASMHQKRCWHSLVSLNGNIYALGGFDGTQRLSSCEVYQPLNDTWIQIPNMNSRRCIFAACAVAPLNIFVFGGCYNNNTLLNSIEMFNISDNTWKTTTIKLPMKLYGSGAVCNEEGELLLIGGRNYLHKPVGSVFKLDVKKGEWSLHSKMKKPRQVNNQVWNQNGKVLVFGGSDSFDAEEWNGRTWEALPSYEKFTRSALHNWSFAAFN